MGKTIKLKKGFDINIKGTPQKQIAGEFVSNTFAIKPPNFKGVAPIPKMLVEEKQEVKAGDPLFFDKKNPDVLFVSPVSGEVISVKRGAKRAIAEVLILSDQKNEFKEFPILDLKTVDREDLVKSMMQSGAWPFLVQRPYGIMADPTVTPKAIYVSGFDSSPLGTDYNFAVVGQQEYLQTGFEVLNILTGSSVNLTLNGGTTNPSELTKLNNVEVHHINGPHPSGNVGVQIHHIEPINKGEVVWTIDLQNVIALGRLYKDGQYNTERLIAVGGPRVKTPQHYRTYIGACVENMLANNLQDEHVRVISGSVLSGTAIPTNGHLGFYDKQLSVLEEGDKHEFFGWLFPSYPRPSLSKTYLSSIFGGKKEFDVNTNTHGEKRALVVTGQYEKVVPMDIYPQQLLKSIIVQDLDLMEGLGIYEIVEEDLALCEFVCTSKTPVQKIIREGLDLMREQG